MAGFVVDASVAVKWLVSEAHSDKAAALLDGKNTLAAPELMFVEATNALWALARRGEIKNADVMEAVDVLADTPVAVPLTARQLLPSAAKLASDLDHPVYDCVYLALSMHTEHPVVTADRRFYEKTKNHPYLSARVVHISDLDGGTA